MIRIATTLLFLVAITSRSRSQSSPPPLSVCDLAKDFGAYRNREVIVRGVFYYGLRQTCPQKCATDPFPAFMDLEGADNDVFNALGKIENRVEIEAKKGKRFEIWITAVGQLQTSAQLSARGPCDRVGSHYFGYGHLGVFPAMLRVKYIRDIEIKENPKSEYDYANMYHGAF